MTIWVLTIWLGLMAAWPSAEGAEPRRVVVFDFELIDTSLEGEVSGTRPDQERRLAMIGDQLRRLLADSGRYLVVDHAPAAARIAEVGYLRACNGCEAAIARELGAELAITGTVQKVSNLILNINLYVRDSTTAARLRAISVDIRGNTDQTWSRGLSYLVRNRLLRD